MAAINEIGPDIFRVSVYVKEIDLQFNHFLVLDEEPLLFHSGLKGMFTEVREAVATVLEPSRIRWIGFSHFESDECGALNHWLEIASKAEPVGSQVGALVSVNDFAIRPARALNDGEVLETGKRRFRLCQTPHLPHGWDSALLFEETSGTLFCSDLFHQVGDVEPLTKSDVVGRSHEALKQYQAGILADYSPYTPYTDQHFARLAKLKPTRFAVMHGSSFEGNGERAVQDLGVVFRDVFGAKT